MTGDDKQNKGVETSRFAQIIAIKNTGVGSPAMRTHPVRLGKKAKRGKIVFRKKGNKKERQKKHGWSLKARRRNVVTVVTTASDPVD